MCPDKTIRLGTRQMRLLDLLCTEDGLDWDLPRSAWSPASINILRALERKGLAIETTPTAPSAARQFDPTRAGYLRVAEEELTEVKCLSCKTLFFKNGHRLCEKCIAGAERAIEMVEDAGVQLRMCKALNPSTFT